MRHGLNFLYWGKTHPTLDRKSLQWVYTPIRSSRRKKQICQATLCAEELAFAGKRVGNLMTLQKNKVAYLGRREIHQMVPSKRGGICENSQEDNNLRVGWVLSNSTNSIFFEEGGGNLLNYAQTLQQKGCLFRQIEQLLKYRDDPKVRFEMILKKSRRIHVLYIYLHPRKQTWIPKMMVWKRWLLLNTAILGTIKPAFHVGKYISPMDPSWECHNPGDKFRNAKSGRFPSFW